jgi:hypothetical protein
VAAGVGDRLIGISDLCDFPPGLHTRGRHIVCRSKIDSSRLSSKEVDAKVRPAAFSDFEVVILVACVSYVCAGQLRR